MSLAIVVIELQNIIIQSVSGQRRLMMKLLVILLILFAKKTNSDKFMRFKRSDLTCNPKFVENATWSLEQVGSFVFINVDFDTLVYLKNVSGKIQSFIKKDEKFYPSMINEKFNVCEFLKLTSNTFSLNYFVQKIFKMVKSDSNAWICIHEVGLHTIFEL